MKVYDCKQGTTEWLTLRAGIPTASDFDSILTRSGKGSASAERYMLTLLAERAMGHPCVEHVSLWMERGSEMERHAVKFYELRRVTDTIPVGFVTNDAGTWGASPDRFVGEDGLLEIKCPSEWIHMGYLLGKGKAYEAYMVQCQGQLMVCEGRKWTDVLSYHPELPEALIRIEPDAKFQSLLKEAVEEFSANLEEAWANIQADGLIQREDTPQSQQDALLEQLRASLEVMNK